MKTGIRTVDLRSDTLTKPTDEMRKAMSEAEVGDDVFGEDPTVNKLQQIAASLFGKEDALFVPSGTMGNLISAMTHCDERGSQVYLGDKTHMNVWEQGGLSQIGGIHAKSFPLRADGTFDIKQMIADHSTGENLHHAKPKLIAVENPNNGKVLPLSYMKQVRDAATQLGLKVHLDGARIGNAITVLNCKPHDITQYVDSASICLSKGLGAPVGSVIVGTKQFISSSRRIRKVLGGGMRQAGILAAAGIISLTKMMDRIKEDHTNAKLFAEGVKNTASDLFTLDIEKIQSNMVWLHLKEHVLANCSANEFREMLADTKDVKICLKVLNLTSTSIRAMFYVGVTEDDVTAAIEKLKYVCNQLRSKLQAQ